MEKLKILTRLNQDIIILTPNQRLATALLVEYGDLQVLLGRKTWEMPEIIPYQNWVKKLCEKDYERFHYALLTDFQTETIWRSIIKQYLTEHYVIQQKIINEIIHAWELVNEWKIDLEHPAFVANEYSQRFKLIVQNYQQQLQKNNFMDMSMAHTWLEQNSLNNSSIKNKIIYLIGFLEFTPRQISLLEQLKQHNHIEIIKNDSNLCEPEVFSFKDTEDEIAGVIEHAKNILTQEPEAKIAWIVPNLHKQRDMITHICWQKNQELIAHQEAAININISVGKKLTEYPLIKILDVLIDFFDKKHTYGEVLQLLYSPYISHAEQEYIERSNLSMQVTTKEKIEFSITEILSLTKKHTPILHEQLLKAKNVYDNFIHAHELPSTWTKNFQNLLHQWGWPGERILNSEEYQTMQKMYEVWHEYCKLDNITHKITFQQALRYFQQLINRIIFQKQTTTSNLHILGILEGIGLEFDYVWFSNLDTKTFPSAAKPNVFIPKILQKQLNMPNSSQIRELSYAESIFKCYQQQAKKQFFCSYHQTEEEFELLPCHFIQNSKIHSQHDVVPLPQRFNQKLIYQEINDAELLAVNHTELAALSGGSDIIKSFSNCPFQAFAKHRLKIRDSNAPKFYYDQKIKGTILHYLLEKFWQDVKEYQNLIILSDQQIIAKLNNYYDQYHQENNCENHDNVLYNLEKNLMIKLIVRYLNHEKTRQPFKVINTEQQKTLQIGDLTLKVRIDRIDQLINNKKILIDYKSSDQDTKKWDGERPEDPQLLIYLLSAIDEYDGICFLTINHKSIKYTGWTAENYEIHGVYPISKHQYGKTWEDLKIEWKAILENLIAKFLAGHYAIDPRDLKQTCGYCKYHSLCRVYETN